MIEIRRLKRTEMDMWDELVFSSPIGTIFHTVDWMDVREKTLKIRTEYLGAFKDKNLVGVFPVSIQNYKIITMSLSPPIQQENPYGAPITLPEEQGVIRKFIDYIDRISNLIDVVFPPTFIRQFPCYSDLDAYARFLTKRYTFFLDLNTSEDSLWRNMESRSRRAIRAAIREGVKIREVTDVALLDIYYEMLTQTYKRSAFSPLPKDFYATVFSTLKPKGRARLLLAEYDDAPIAGVFFLIFKDRMNYWTGASREEFWKVRPNNLVHWEAIKWAKQKGLAIYDLQGANIPSIAKFKASFGGKLVEYHWLFKATPFVAKLAKLYQAYRKFRQLRKE